MIPEAPLKVPPTTTHVWTPAYEVPFVSPWCFRRAFYRKTLGEWYSYSFDKEWVKTGNPPEWFTDEADAGYFVSIKKFNSPGFVIIKEKRDAN